MPAARAPSSVPGSQSPATLPAERDASHLQPLDLERLVEQASGQSSRAVARVIAEADPLEKVAPDTLRPLGEGRWILKCVIDEESQEGLRLLKDLLAHVDPTMSWRDLVGRLVQEGLRRHDPRLGGRRRAVAAAAGARPRPGQAAAAQVTDAATPADDPAAAGHAADTSPPGDRPPPNPRPPLSLRRRSRQRLPRRAAGGRRHPHSPLSPLLRRRSRQQLRGPPRRAPSTRPEPAADGSLSAVLR